MGQIQNLVLLLRSTSIISKSRRELRGAEVCVCKCMMCCVCLFMNYVFIRKLVSNFKSIKVY